MGVDPTPEAVVRAFFADVRSGRDTARAHDLMSPRVLAHQLVSEAPAMVERTPADYATHVEEMTAAYGDFDLAVDELLADGDRIYVRWTQTGRHVGPVDGFAPTGLPVVEVASAVYRVEAGRIAEYWIQIDRAGIEAQLRCNAG